ncbi:MAG: hypothetical protein ACRD29_10650 [Acidimicrobiales bacterium]
MAGVPRRLAAIVAGVLLGLVACGGNDDEATTTRPQATTTTEAPTTTVPPTTTTAFVSEAAVLSANRAAWDAFFAAQNPPNPDLPELLATHTELALFQAREDIQEWLTRGLRFESQIIESSPEVLELADRRAVLTDCLTWTNTSYRLDTGAVDETEPSLQVGFRIVMVPENGAWKWSERARDPAVC